MMLGASVLPGNQRRHDRSINDAQALEAVERGRHHRTLPGDVSRQQVRATLDLADRCSYSFRSLSQLSVLPTFGSNDGSLVP